MKLSRQAKRAADDVAMRVKVVMEANRGEAGKWGAPLDLSGLKLTPQQQEQLGESDNC